MIACTSKTYLWNLPSLTVGAKRKQNHTNICVLNMNWVSFCVCLFEMSHSSVVWSELIIVCRLREAEQPQNSAMFPRLGSKFRYSGRTLYQARHSSQILDRPDPYFERSQPARSTYAAPSNRSRSVDEREYAKRVKYVNSKNVAMKKGVARATLLLCYAQLCVQELCHLRVVVWDVSASFGACSVCFTCFCRHLQCWKHHPITEQAGVQRCQPILSWLQEASSVLGYL